MNVDVNFDGSIVPDVARSISPWRNSLLCISATKGLLFLAKGDCILVYDRISLQDPDLVAAELCHLENPAQGVLTRRRYGAQPGPFDGSEINALRIFMLGQEEVLVSVDGLGRAFIRHVNALNGVPIRIDVSASTWGLDIQQRLLLLSSNSHCAYLCDLEARLPPRDHEQTDDKAKDRYLLRGPSANVPNVSLSHDTTMAAAVDVMGYLSIWHLALDSETTIEADIHVTLGDEDDMGWDCQWISESAFRITEDQVALAASTKTVDSPNPVRSLRANLAWWATVGANIVPQSHDLHNLNAYEIMLSIRYAARGLQPSHTFESHWQSHTPDRFSKWVPASDQDLLLVSTVDRVILMHTSDVKKPHAICYYPFGSRFSTNDSFERINMIRPLFDLGLVVIASQRGLACILQLIKCFERDVNLQKTGRCSYSFECCSIVACPEPHKSGELIGMDVLQTDSHRAQVFMLYRSGRLLIADIEVESTEQLVKADLLL